VQGWGAWSLSEELYSDGHELRGSEGLVPSRKEMEWLEVTRRGNEIASCGKIVCGLGKLLGYRGFPGQAPLTPM
jgi:hypothetical protein